MADEPAADAALRPLAPGRLIRLGGPALSVDVAPEAGGRIAQIHYQGVPWLVGHDETPAAIGWGCYPMLPWAGRIRDGRFRFDGRNHRLPPNLGAHAIHGVGFVLPWQVRGQSMAAIELVLPLPEDERWPFGGVATQRIAISRHGLRLHLSVEAGPQPMPLPVIGWHPWFRKPDALDFAPDACFPRDSAEIAIPPPGAVPCGPWDDCFLNHRPVLLHRRQQTLRLRSGCTHWVVFDEPAHATCVEPQTAPPDAFNLYPDRGLAPGATISAGFRLRWSCAPAAR